MSSLTTAPDLPSSLAGAILSVLLHLAVLAPMFWTAEPVAFTPPETLGDELEGDDGEVLEPVNVGFLEDAPEALLIPKVEAVATVPPPASEPPTLPKVAVPPKPPEPDAEGPGPAPPPPAEAAEAGAASGAETAAADRRAQRGRSTSSGGTRKGGVKGKTDKPCPPPVDTIDPIGENTWKIERTLIEYYATHLGELMKLGTPYVHTGPDGKRDGFRVRLSRCSILRDGGLRSGDVIHSINGVKIYNVLDAVNAYFKLRTKPVLTVKVTRANRPLELQYHVEQKVKRKNRNRTPEEERAE